MAEQAVIASRKMPPDAETQDLCSRSPWELDAIRVEAFIKVVFEVRDVLMADLALPEVEATQMAARLAGRLKDRCVIAPPGAVPAAAAVDEPGLVLPRDFLREFWLSHGTAGQGAGLQLLKRLALRETSGADIESLSRVVGDWIRSGGRQSLQAALGINEDIGREWRRLRDGFVTQYAEEVGLLSQVRAGDLRPWTAACRVAHAWEAFIDRGSWRRWNALGGPPESAFDDRAQVALYFATALNDASSLGARSILDLIFLPMLKS
jgi:hypothetical protein